MAALAIVTAAAAADEKKKFDPKELVSHLVERTGEITHEIYAFEAKLDARLDPDRIRRAGSLRHRVEELEGTQRLLSVSLSLSFSVSLFFSASFLKFTANFYTLFNPIM